MALVEGSIRFNQTPEVVARDFFRAAGAIESMREPLIESIRQVVIPSVQESFEEQGRFGRWEPITKESLRSRRNPAARSRPDKILRDTGTLKRQATSLVNWDIDGQSEPATAGFDWNRVARAGAAGRHPWVHQFGSGDVPEREFISLADTDADRIEEIFADWYIERISMIYGAGRGHLLAGMAL